MMRRARIAAALLLLLLLAQFAHALTLREGIFAVDYDPSEEALASRTLSILVKALDEFEPALAAGTDPIRVIVCGTLQEFVQHAPGYTMPSVLGLAMPERGLIILKAPELAVAPHDFRGTVRHELVHVLLARNVDMDNVPRWLNEGIAMVLSGEHRYESAARVAQMYFSGNLIEYRHLENVFLAPGRELQFGNAYAQSLSMTRFLLRSLGKDRFWEMVRMMKTEPFHAALKSCLNMNVIEFYDAWVRSMWKFALIFSLVSGFSAFQVMALLTFAAYIRKRRRGQRIMREWEDEEGEMSGELSDDDPPYDPESMDEDDPSCGEFEDDSMR